MLKLRGLPPDIEVAEIRLYIKQRCPMESVMLGELEAEASGTRRVTVATTCDADAATLSRALSGSRLGAYTLRVEPHQTQNASSVNFRDNGVPSGYNEKDNVDHGGYGRKVTGGSVGLGGNSNVNIGGLGGLGGSSEIGSLGRNRKRRATYSRSLGGNNGRESGGLRSLGGNNERDNGGLGGLRANNERDGGGLSDLRGNNVGHGGSLSGLGGNSGRDTGGLGGLGENNWSDGVNLSGVGGKYGRDSGGLGGLGGNNGRDGGGLSGFGGNNVRDSSGLGGLRRNNGRDSSGLGGLGGDNMRDTGGFSGLVGNYGSDGVGLGGLRGTTGIDDGDIGGHAGYSGRNDGDLGGVGGHSSQLYGRGSGGMGKRVRGDNNHNPVGISSKRMRHSSETGGVFGSDSSQGQGGYSGSDGSYGNGNVGYKNANNSGQGGYSGPDSSYGSGFVGNNNANNSRHGVALGGHNELNSFSGGSGLGGLNAMGEHSPHSYSDRRESEKVPPWVGMKPQYSPYRTDRRMNKGQPAKNNALLGNPMTAEVQTFSPSPFHFRAPGMQNPVTLNIMGKPAHDNRFDVENFIKKKCSRIYESMVDRNKIDPKYKSVATKFEEKMRFLIKRRLRELTNEPFCEKLISLYREAYPTSTDEETMKSVSKQLSLPEIPIPPREGTKRDSHAVKPGEVSVSTLEDLREACACQVADEVLYERAMSRRERKAFPQGAKDKLKAARAMVRDQLDEIMAGNKGTLTTSEELHQLYRQHHPPEEDPALEERVMRMAATAMSERKSGVKKAETITANKMAVWREIVVCQIADTALFGKNLNKALRNALPHNVHGKIMLARQIVRKRLEDILAGEHDEVTSQSDLERLYRTVHRTEEDAALKERVMREGREEEPNAAAELTKNSTAEDETPDKVVDPPADTDITLNSLDQVVATKLEGWRGNTVARVAYEALFGLSLSPRKRKRLRNDANEKIRLAQEIVRKQLETILAKEHEELRSRTDFYKLYRKFHPPAEDAALNARVMRQLGEPSEAAKENAAIKMVAWRESVAWRIANKALFGKVLSSERRKALSQDAQQQIKLAREIVRKRLEDILAAKYFEVPSRRDLLKLYRTVHRARDDPALKKRVMREARIKKPKAAVGENETVCQRNGDDIKPREGESGDTSKKSDSTTDGIKNTDTDDIEDKVDLSSLDIEINADDLEDY